MKSRPNQRFQCKQCWSSLDASAADKAYMLMKRKASVMLAPYYTIP